MPQSRKPSRTKLGDVAKRAGVSLTTASLVLGDKAEKHRISEDALQRVRQAAADLDYSPNRLVHSLQRGSTSILSFFNGFRNRIENDLYMDRLSTAVERAGGRHGYDILVNCNFSRTPEEMYQHLNGGVVDGLLFFAPQPNDPLLPLLRASRLPVVLLNYTDEAGLLSSVQDDCPSGMRAVAERLLALGHRRIVALNEVPVFNREARIRIDLLRHYLAESGVALLDEWVYDHADRERLLSRLQASDAPTAVFCWRDYLAYQLLSQCEAHRIAVPEHLSVIGYDGLPWHAATRHTAASVFVDMDALAEETVGLLARLVQGVEPEIVEKRIPVQLHPGTTLASARRT